MEEVKAIVINGKDVNEIISNYIELYSELCIFRKCVGLHNILSTENVKSYYFNQYIVPIGLNAFIKLFLNDTYVKLCGVENTCYHLTYVLNNNEEFVKNRYMPQRVTKLIQCLIANFCTDAIKIMWYSGNFGKMFYDADITAISLEIFQSQNINLMLFMHSIRKFKLPGYVTNSTLGKYNLNTIKFLVENKYVPIDYFSIHYFIENKQFDIAEYLLNDHTNLDRLYSYIFGKKNGYL